MIVGIAIAAVVVGGKIWSDQVNAQGRNALRGSQEYADYLQWQLDNESEFIEYETTDNQTPQLVLVGLAVLLILLVWYYVNNRDG